MAQGESVALTSPKAWRGRIDWSYTQSIADNCTYVTAVCYQWKTDGHNTGGNTAFSGQLQVGSHTAGISFMTARPGENEVASLYSVAISHNSDGTGQVYIGAYIDGPTDMSSLRNVRLEGGQTFTLPTIPRDVTLNSAPNFNDNQNPTITYTNQAGYGCKDLIGRIDIANVPNIDRNLGKTDTSYTFQLTQAELNSIYQKYPNSREVAVTFKIGFRFDYGSYKWTAPIEKTLTITPGSPAITYSALDTNPDSVDATGDSNVVIRGISNVAVSATFTPQKYATIASNFIRNGKQYIYETSGTFNGCEDGNFTFYAKDSRGFWDQKDLKKKLIDYVMLTCNLDSSADLIDETTATIHIKASGNYFKGSFGKKDNTLRVWYRYKKGEEPYCAWIEMTPTVGYDNTYSAAADLPSINYLDSYTVQVSAADLFHTDLRSAEKVVQAHPIFDWSKKDFVFRVPVHFEKGGTGLAADCIIAQGKTGLWSWRKWESGTAECWCQRSRTYDISYKTGALFTGKTYLGIEPYPFTFVEAPCCMCFSTSPGIFVIPYVEGNAEKCPGVDIASPTQGTKVANVCFYAIGRWKF